MRRRRRIVDLPLNATEDRVSGSVDVARALASGEQALEPGLLAEANRGILYVDEINLLDDHLTDVLLDAAALGVNVVEREGVSVSHPARFLLVGTMNEEEGELRPQIADRLGLEVEVEALKEPESRAEIVRRREAFSADPAAFRAQWADAQSDLAERVAAAEARLGSVRLEEDLYAAVGQVVVRSGVESHRADITIVECAKASAALAGRDAANADDVLAAAELALGHRLALDPFGPAPRVQPQVLRRLLEDALEAEVTPKKAAGGARSGPSSSRARTPSRPSRACGSTRPRCSAATAAATASSAGGWGVGHAPSSAGGAASTRAIGSRGPATTTSRWTPLCAQPLPEEADPCASGRRTSAGGFASIAHRSASASSSTTAGRCTPSGWWRR